MMPRPEFGRICPVCCDSHSHSTQVGAPVPSDQSYPKAAKKQMLSLVQCMYAAAPHPMGAPEVDAYGVTGRRPVAA